MCFSYSLSDFRVLSIKSGRCLAMVGYYKSVKSAPKTVTLVSLPFCVRADHKDIFCEQIISAINLVHCVSLLILPLTHLIIVPLSVLSARVTVTVSNVAKRIFES